MTETPRRTLHPLNPIADWRTWKLPSDFWAPGGGSGTIYRFYDGDRDLLYIGIVFSGRPIERWKGHRDAARWWPLVAYVATERPKCAEGELALLERAAIRAEKPRFNKVHTRSRTHIAVSTRQGPQAIVEIFRYHLLDDDFAALVEAFKAEPERPLPPFAPPANDPNR